MSFKWANLMLERMEDLSSRPTPQQLCFFDRSFFTPYVFTRQGQNTRLYVELYEELKLTYPMKIVLCKAPQSVVASRLQERFERGTQEERRIRQGLGEMSPEFIRAVEGRYKELEDRGIFDIIVDTSLASAQECAENLVEKLS